MKAESEILHQKLAEIHNALKKRYPEEPHIGGLTGVAGMALFEFYYAKLTDQDDYAELGLEMLSHCMDKINAGYGYPTFAGGIAGFGWVMDHLTQNDFLDSDNDELLSDLDDYLKAQMDADFGEGNFDYLHGGIGYGLYFLNRYKSTKDDNLKQRYVAYLADALKSLENLAEEDGEQLKWLKYLPESTNPRSYDFSHSHGMSGIANFLCRVYSIEPLKVQAKKLLEGLLAYLLANKAKENTNLCLFPAQILDASKLNYSVRLAWCYGDFGPAFTFSKAGKVLGRTDLSDLAIQIFHREAAKEDPAITRVNDAGFCHGSFGNAHIFHHLHHQTGASLYKERTSFWIQDGLGKANYADGPAGFKQWNAMSKRWVNAYTVLEGVAGIGLVLINQLSEKYYDWDEMFMIS